MSLADRIFAVDDLSHEDVTVPEWGAVTLRISEIPADERLDYEAYMADLDAASPKKRANAAMRAAVMLRFMARDPETGEPAFTQADEARLAKRAIRVLLRLTSIANRVNAVGDQEVTKIAGESGAVPSGASPSA